MLGRWVEVGAHHFVPVAAGGSSNITAYGKYLKRKSIEDVASGHLAFVFAGLYLVSNGSGPPIPLSFCGIFSGGTELQSCRE
jgi:hypothetical protein